MSRKTKDLFNKLEKFQFEMDYSPKFDFQLDYNNILSSPVNVDHNIQRVNERIESLDVNNVNLPPTSMASTTGLGITTIDDEQYEDDYLDLYSSSSDMSQDNSGMITRDTSIHSLDYNSKTFPKDFSKDLDILDQGIENSKLILDCVEEMLINENDEILHHLTAFISDIEQSVPHNTVIVKGDHFINKNDNRCSKKQPRHP